MVRALKSIIFRSKDTPVVEGVKNAEALARNNAISQVISDIRNIIVREGFEYGVQQKITVTDQQRTRFQEAVDKDPTVIAKEIGVDPSQIDIGSIEGDIPSIVFTVRKGVSAITDFDQQETAAAMAV